MEIPGQFSAEINTARVKDFHLSLHYSEDRVSQVLKQLVREGWLTMERDEADKRMRKVHASDRLRLLFGEYQRFLLEMLFDVERQHIDELQGIAE